MTDITQDPQQKEQIKQVVKEVMQEQQQQSQQPPPSEEQQKLQKAILDCANAHNIALQTMNYCISQGGKFVEPKSFKKLQDCAEITDVTAKILLRESELKSEIAKLCSKSCEEMVKVCDQFAQDQQMKACKQYVQMCAESCKQL